MAAAATQFDTKVAVAGVMLCTVCFAAPLVAVFRTISADEAALMTGQCHVLSSLSSVVLAFLSYYFLAWLVRDRVLTVAFAERLKRKRTDEERAKWRAKIVSLLLPISVRSLCFLLLLPGWAHFSLESGLAFNTTGPMGRCNIESDAIGAARAFYMSRYLLAALMLYELASAERGELHWSVLMHHVVTVIACSVTTDDVLLSVVGGSLSSNTADGVGFVTFFYAALTTVETTLVLTYHLQAGQRLLQAQAMGLAAGIQVVVTSVFFLILPSILLSNTYRSISPAVFVLLLLVNIVMFVVESFIASVRVAIARKKWFEHRAEREAASSAAGDDAAPAAVEVRIVSSLVRRL